MATKTEKKKKSKVKKALSVISSIALVISIITGVFLAPRMRKPDIDIEPNEWKTNYTYVFVHGLSGWGSYDKQYKLMPYWGMLGGDLMKYLTEQGYSCRAASVAPQSSAWDRACELYAQLTGTVVDYGKAHSEKMNHERFGEDFTGRALIDSWSEEDKITLLGHSFGGATVRMLVSLMAQGDKEEIAATDEKEISPLFTGGKAEYIYSVVTLAAPHNGTSAYGIGNSSDEKLNEVKKKSLKSRLMSVGTAPKRDGRDDKDYADYDMFIDNALALNDRLALPDNIYYFSYACSSSTKNSDGTYTIDNSKTESLFRDSGNLMGGLSGTTPNGYTIDETWFENDGLVNTISAKAPFNQPSTEFDSADIKTGVWNIMPVLNGDHMSLQGGLMKRVDIRQFYAELLDAINRI